MNKVGIVVFPGSNCERDVHYVLNSVLNIPASYVWHNSGRVSEYDSVVIPGGFSYGDRLRAGAIAAHSPVVNELKKMARQGHIILGICNGFQILAECNLLPGALVMNSSLSFVCKWATIEVNNNNTTFTSSLKRKQKIIMPVAHAEGRYVANDRVLRKMARNNQIAFRYFKDNPNGSIENIAGVCNEMGNVMGIMPHPERALVNGESKEAATILQALSTHR